MREKSKIVQIVKRASVVTWASIMIGVMLLVVTVVIVLNGINLSNHEIELAEVLNCTYASERNLYPSVGIEYELEARILGEGTVGNWCHDLVAAEYGDTVEVRLKVVAANPSDIDRAALEKHTLYAFSSGFEHLVAANEYAQVALPDGSLADYPEDMDDEHAAYFAVGIFKFTSKDWWKGYSSSTVIPLDPDMSTKLEVIAPYCDVNITVILALIIAAGIFGIALPLVYEKGTKCTLTLVYSRGAKNTK